MSDNRLNQQENLPELLNSDYSSENISQPNNDQINYFSQFLIGIFILIGGISYLFKFPTGTLVATAGILILVNCIRQLIATDLKLDWITLIIGFLCLSKGISTLFEYEISLLPILFCLLGIYVISQAWQRWKA